MDAPDKRAPKKRSARVAFFARRDAIRADLAQGWTVTAVYELHAEQLGISYSQFARYVNLHVKGKAPQPRQNRAAATAPLPSRPGGAETSAAAAARVPIVTPSIQPRRFVFDPTAVHRRKDELI